VIKERVLVRRHHNGRPEIRISEFRPSSVSFVDGQHQACKGRDTLAWAWVRDTPWKPEQTRDGRCPACHKPLTSGQPMVLCPDGCGRWVFVVRGVLKPHHAPHAGNCPGRSSCPETSQVRCPGSGQRIIVDLTRDEHLALLFKIQTAADDRRRTRVHGVRPAPVLPPVCRMGLAAA
jgi:hypothetical protein